MEYFLFYKFVVEGTKSQRDLSACAHVLMASRLGASQTVFL